MAPITLIFFGSFQHYSAKVLQSLIKADGLEIKAVATTPPTESKNPVHLMAEAAGLHVFTPETLDEPSLAELPAADLMVTAGYGKLLPDAWLRWPTRAALNLHFSLLPKYRGANPAEWALLCGETETGVTLIEMSPEFDTGKIVASASVVIEAEDTRETVYEKLYELGGQVLPKMLRAYVERKTVGTPQPASPTPYASRFQRADGFIKWSALELLMVGQIAPATSVSPTLQKVLLYTKQPLDATFVERATRALAGFPSLWTEIPTAKGTKRMKLISATVEGKKLNLEQVQVEGKAITRWAESKNILLD